MKMSSVGLDMVDRDPNDMNAFVKTQFHDVIGEPDSAHSMDCVFRNAFKCFNISKGCCYRVLTLICAIPAAFCWGCDFACITFSHIWCITPCFRCFELNFACFKNFWSTVIHCCYDPCYEAAALLFSKINVTNFNR